MCAIRCLLPSCELVSEERQSETGSRLAVALLSGGVMHSARILTVDAGTANNPFHGFGGMSGLRITTTASAQTELSGRRGRPGCVQRLRSRDWSLGYRSSPD